MNLRERIQSHAGQFLCQEIGNEHRQKSVSFEHDITSPGSTPVPDVPGLQAFYDEFGSLELYRDPESGESAFYIAPPEEWVRLDEAFHLWIEDVVDSDDDEVGLPDWIEDRLVIGEIPGSGNYLLMPVAGNEAGKVFEFEHDGFEFIEHASSLVGFVERALDPDAVRLAAMASHLRFITDDSPSQWWIVAMQDGTGRRVTTDV